MKTSKKKLANACPTLSLQWKLKTQDLPSPLQNILWTLSWRQSKSNMTPKLSSCSYKPWKASCNNWECASSAKMRSNHSPLRCYNFSKAVTKKNLALKSICRRWTSKKKKSLMKKSSNKRKSKLLFHNLLEPYSKHIKQWLLDLLISSLLISCLKYSLKIKLKTCSNSEFSSLTIWFSS